MAEQARVHWSETEGSVSLPWGTITLQAASGVLMLRAEATSEGDLRRLEHLVAGHVERFGRRDGLQVNWQQPAPVAQEGSFGATDVPGAAGGTIAGRSRHLKLLGLFAVVLVFVAHLGLGGVLVTNWHWTSGTAGAVLVLVLVKTAVLGSVAVRRRAAKRR
ncbi:DUF2218 domain-containing protein [Streptomyces sp. G35A]